MMRFLFMNETLTKVKHCHPDKIENKHCHPDKMENKNCHPDKIENTYSRRVQLFAHKKVNKSQFSRLENNTY